jgi:nicotinate-nucleotide adenylyltransferase
MKPSRHAQKEPNAARAPLGILGGIFDPVHNGHLAAACLARDHFNLDKVYLIPAGMPPHKAGAVSAGARHRLAMLKLAVKGSKGLCVWDGEIRRPGISYTVDTIRRIRKKHPQTDLYFIIGSDNLGEIVTWHKYRQILSSVVLCVAHRPGFPSKIPAELRVGEIRTFPSPQWAISSTMIRRYVSRGYSCDYLLPPGVAEYIRKQGLYKKASSGRHDFRHSAEETA